MFELAVIIPVYNEQDIIKEVILSWLTVLRSSNIDFIIKVYNDGSTDSTLEILQELEQNNKELIIIDKPNSGHGPTILKGYKSTNSKWVFQVDSDNEIKSSSFPTIWNAKNDYDLIIGNRQNRKSIMSRRFITFICYLIIRIFSGSGVKDVNSPFRLYRMEKFNKLLSRIPQNSFAPNVLLTAYAIKKNLNIFELSVSYEERSTGITSINKVKLLKAAYTSFIQTIFFKY